MKKLLFILITLLMVTSCCEPVVVYDEPLVSSVVYSRSYYIDVPPLVRPVPRPPVRPVPGPRYLGGPGQHQMGRPQGGPRR